MLTSSWTDASHIQQQDTLRGSLRQKPDNVLTHATVLLCVELTPHPVGLLLLDVGPDTSQHAVLLANCHTHQLRTTWTTNNRQQQK